MKNCGGNYLGEIARVPLHNMYTFELYDTHMPEFVERSSTHLHSFECLRLLMLLIRLRGRVLQVSVCFVTCACLPALWACLPALWACLPALWACLPEQISDFFTCAFLHVLFYMCFLTRACLPALWACLPALWACLLALWACLPALWACLPALWANS